MFCASTRWVLPFLVCACVVLLIGFMFWCVMNLYLLIDQAYSSILTLSPACGAFQIGLDGIRMLDPSTSRMLRIYPLDTVTRLEVSVCSFSPRPTMYDDNTILLFYLPDMTMKEFTLFMI